MIALLAAALAAAQPAPAPAAALAFSMSTATAARACGLWDATPVRREMPAPALRKMTELPPADWELAVLRLGPDGCSKPVVVQSGVQGDGRFARPGKD